MDHYTPGDRVELVATDDPHTRLRPGARGTVSGWDPHLAQLRVQWDDGSRLSMILDGSTGDEVRKL